MYPPVDSAELARHATEVGRVLLAAGLAPAGSPRRWFSLARLAIIRTRLPTKYYRYFRQLGLVVQDIGYAALPFSHLLHMAWLLAYDDSYQDPEDWYWESYE